MNSDSKRSSKYQKIPFDDRMWLIRQVCHHKRKISEAAEEMGINSSTARMIVFKYRQNGTVFEKRELQSQRAQEAKEKNQEKKEN